MARKNEQSSQSNQFGPQSAKRQPDRSIKVVLSSGAEVLLRPATGRDVSQLDEDEWASLTRLIARWVEPDGTVREGANRVMAVELSSAGFLDISDALFLKSILRKLFSPDLEQIGERTSVTDNGRDGLTATLPSGFEIQLRRPDGYDLEQAEFGGEGIEASLGCIRLAALASLRWGNHAADGDKSAVSYEQALGLEVDDFFAVVKVVSGHFFRVATVEL